MGSLNFIGGEKGGVGKSVMSRALAQYFIDKGRDFVGFDTDRSHASFTRFYPQHASPVVVDAFEGMDAIANALEETDADGNRKSVIVDLAAQTAQPLARWIQEADVLTLLAEMGVKTNFWHVSDAGKDSLDMLGRLVTTFGSAPRYIVVKNYGRGADFEMFEQAAAVKKAVSLGATVVELFPLHETSMHKIDVRNLGFLEAATSTSGPQALAMLERQRVKTWLRHVYAMLDPLEL